MPHRATAHHASCLPGHEHLLAAPAGARYSVTSCDLRILMDQSAESIPSHNPSGRQDDRWVDGPERWDLPQGADRTGAGAIPPRCRMVHTVLAPILSR
jgi:hypothetical protein